MNANLGFLINDLRSVCNEFYSLIRQIDTVAHKVEDKFSFILKSLENTYNNSPLPSSSSSEIISDSSDNGNLKISKRLQDKSCLSNGKKLSDFNSSAEKILKRLDSCNTNNNLIKQDNSLLHSNNRNSLNTNLICEIEKKSGLNYNDSVLNKNAKSVRSKSAIPSANHNLQQQDSLIKKSSDKTDFKLEKINEKIPSSIQNNSMESSFYEDQLDNELENFSCTTKAASSESNCFV
jgi:hypothetical protein